ncbi:restriction endonuclease subunit S [Mycobacteroides abscessus]|uniref:restriction endonuclease subunit S n=1 Tax=Mycobacteroides abscessus TaxID=36809 RepID=UPI0018782ABF|nr:hypothetical protein [Mycobacteroides abscessus]MDM2082859.1 restriction endonuclease subunit S [Mycobacteroides abscessus]MDM2086033.1 restriction endonuclease subunit S [Mycobacteroides abscessus]
MSRITDLISEYCSAGVEFRRLGDLLDYEQPGEYLVTSATYDDSFATPVLTAGQTFVLGYTDELHGVYRASVNDPVVIFDDFTTSFKWVDFPFKAKSSAMKMLTPKRANEADLRFIYYAMQTISYKPQDHARQWIGIYSDIKIPVPPPEIQREIVSILDKMEALESELESELEYRSAQFAFYRDMLLSFDDDDCEWLTLREASIDFGRGKSRHRPRNDARLYGGRYPFIQTGDVRNSGHLITEYSQTYSEAGLSQSKLWPRGTICITIAANIAETGILDFDACFPDSVIGMVVNPRKTSQHYVEYLLQSLKAHLAAKGQGSAQANINLATFENERFPFPSLQEQERIVKILDTFDKLVSDLSVGLPAEIEARRKQYEYYRDTLLTFQEATA